MRAPIASSEAIAAVARTLIDSGYAHVRPLLGGLDAWTAAKYEVEFPCPDCALPDDRRMPPRVSNTE